MEKKIITTATVKITLSFGGRSQTQPVRGYIRLVNGEMVWSPIPPKFVTKSKQIKLLTS